MKKISSYVLKYWYGYLAAILCMLMAIGLDMLYPEVSRRIIKNVFLGGKMEMLPGLLLFIVIIGIGRAVGGYLKEFMFDKYSSYVGAEMRRDLFDHIQGLSREYFEKTNTGELMARVKDDIDAIWRVVGFVGMLVIEVTVHVVSVLFCMFRLNWKLTFIPLVFMIFCGVIAIVMEQKLGKVYEDISEENAALTTVAEENLAGVRTVKAFAREEFEIEKFMSHNKRYYELNMKQSRVLVRYYPFFQFVSVCLPVCATVAGGFLIWKGEMDIADLFAYVEYTRNCTWPMQMLGWLTNDVSSAIASRKKIKKIYENTSSIVEAKEPVKLEEIKGEIAFENVSLTLEETNILSDISFHIKPGKTLGIMGATGSGKSSIVNLIQRFYDPTSGTITLDGVDLKDLALSDVRGSNAVVMQDVFLFSDTIAENIKMGKKESMGLQEIQKAAEFAEAQKFIEEMDEQYETVIGERGVGLSGGQKQRISIARALSKKAPILVLDDSTSALDMETEHEIQKTLNGLTGVTKVIIAHRISAVRHADEIIYLEDGKIAERGTHEELMEKRGLYHETFKAQYGNVGGECYGN